MHLQILSESSASHKSNHFGLVPDVAQRSSRHRKPSFKDHSGTKEKYNIQFRYIVAASDTMIVMQSYEYGELSFTSAGLH